MIIIKGGRYLDVKNSKFLLGDIAIEKGKIKEIGENIKGENGDLVIDASGKIVTPGLVEAHCHLGLLGDSVGKENDDLNERSGAICPELRAIDAIDPMDKVFEEAYQGGVTSVATGPGSGNILGGQFAAIKTYGKRIDNMIIKE